MRGSIGRTKLWGRYRRGCVRRVAYVLSKKARWSGAEVEVRNERSEERSFIEFSERANCESSLTSYFCTMRIRRFACDSAALRRKPSDCFHGEGLSFVAFHVEPCNRRFRELVVNECYLGVG